MSLTIIDVVEKQLCDLYYGFDTVNIQSGSEFNKDRHAAWVALCGWFDGDQVRNEISEGLWLKLDTLKLHNETAATQ